MLSDRRIQDGLAIEEMVASRGWKLFAERLTLLRAEAHQQVLLVDETRALWRGRMNAFDEALGITDEFLKDREIAEADKKERKLYGQDDAGNVPDDSGASSDIGAE